MTVPSILLVDDEVSFVETMAKRLTKRNFATITAFSAEESLEKLAANQDLDVIVLDIKMPGMDGIAALKEIKKVSPLTEVIMLTGHATIESILKNWSANWRALPKRNRRMRKRSMPGKAL